jgi:hypothetical protein
LEFGESIERPPGVCERRGIRSFRGAENIQDVEL